MAVQLRREEPESAVSEVEAFYKKFLNITNMVAFKKGEFTLLNVVGSNDAGRLIAYRWAFGNQKILCVINFSDQNGSGSIVLSNAESKDGKDEIPVVELLSDQTYYRSATQMRTTGLFVIVNSWYAQIFSY